MPFIGYSIETNRKKRLSPLGEHGQRLVRTVSLVRAVRSDDEEETGAAVFQRQTRATHHLAALFRRRQVAQNERKDDDSGSCK